MKIPFLQAIKMYITWNRTKDLIYCIYFLKATFRVHWASTVKCSCRDKRLRDLMFKSHATICIEGWNVKLLFSWLLQTITLFSVGGFSPIFFSFFLHRARIIQYSDQVLTQTCQKPLNSQGCKHIDPKNMSRFSSSPFPTCARHHPNTPELGFRYISTHFKAGR